MKNIYSEYFRVASINVFNNFHKVEFETTFEDKYTNYSTRDWKNKKLEINFYISFFLVENKYFFKGAVYSKLKSTAIDLTLLIPFYYPEFSKPEFVLNTSEESEINPEIDAFLSKLLSVFKTAPLSEIISGNLWLDGFSHHPHDQVLGIPWTPPEKLNF